MVDDLGTERYMAEVGPTITEKELLLEVSHIPDLPAPISKLIDNYRTKQNAANAGAQDGVNSADEISTRLQVIKELRTLEANNRIE